MDERDIQHTTEEREWADFTAWLERLQCGDHPHASITFEGRCSVEGCDIEPDDRRHDLYIDPGVGLLPTGERVVDMD